MKFVFSLTLFALLGCSSSQVASPNAEDKNLSFYTDVKGPSEASGDCGGYAFWLRSENGQFNSGEVSEFEGGCGIHKKSITEIKHDVKTGQLSFHAPSAPDQFVQFKGKVETGRLLGMVIHLDSKMKPVSAHVSKLPPRSFEQTDPDKFRAKLPQ